MPDVPPSRDRRDRVDLSGPSQLGQGRNRAAPEPLGPRRPFLQIWFRCCHAYGRLTRTTDGLAYAGRCPRCGASCEVPIGPGGTNRRAFEAR